MEEGSNTNDINKPEDKQEFKKPVLIGRIGKLPKKAKSDGEKPTTTGQQSKEPLDSEPPMENAKVSSLPPAVLLKEMSTPIPYKEPKWSGLCPEGSEYGLEVLKSGMIVEKVDLTSKPFYVFGRLANCDVVMAHPTISRHHCILQYKAFASEGEPSPGWYIYDLGSTHGTFVNKDRLKAQHYTRVRVGHQIKFGNSTRTYIVLGPDFDCEGESELTVTEIKQKALELKLNRDRLIQEAKEQRERDKLEEERKREEQGIDWGMGEDAEAETDLSENPYASTTNEELYLTDPKKTLRGYFEREGHELSYQCDERGVGQFLCRVELPLDDHAGRPVVAEVIHRGKKKEAVIACALEACRILDRAGLLRQATHESRSRKRKDWSENDYYDSDEDTFLDRTGVVEKKRQMRMKKEANEPEKPLTYDDLVKQVSEIESKIKSEESCLERLRSSSKSVEQNDDSTDALDQYMNSIGTQSMSHKADISKTKMRIQTLKRELIKTQRLADIARPALLNIQTSPAIKHSQNVVYGKRLKLKDDIKKPQPKHTKQAEESEFVEEVDSDDETQTANKDNTNETINDEPDEKVIEKEVKIETKERSKSKDTETSSEKLPEESKSEKEVNKRTFGPMRPPENYVVPENYFEEQSDRDLGVMEDD